MKTALLLTALLAMPLAHAHGDKKSMPAEETASEPGWGIAGKRAACLHDHPRHDRCHALHA